MKGMSFGMFCTALLTMSMVAYQEDDSSITPANKTRALLHFMWRAVNTSEKIKGKASDVRHMCRLQGSVSL